MLNARSLFLIAGIATAFLATESVLAQQTIKPLGRRIVGGAQSLSRRATVAAGAAAG
jgi:hypothetical protein